MHDDAAMSATAHSSSITVTIPPQNTLVISNIDSQTDKASFPLSSTLAINSSSPRPPSSSNSSTPQHSSSRVSQHYNPRLTPSPTSLTPYERSRKPMSVDKFDIDIPPTRQIESDFTCPLCNKLILHAMTSKVCCHSYCEACITGHLDFVTKYCPLASRTSPSSSSSTSNNNNNHQQQPVDRQQTTPCSAKLPTRRCLRKDDQLDTIIASLFPDELQKRVESVKREKDMMEASSKSTTTSAAAGSNSTKQQLHRMYSNSSSVAVLSANHDDDDDSATFHYHRDNDSHYGKVSPPPPPQHRVNHPTIGSSSRYDKTINHIPIGVGKRNRKRKIMVEASPATSADEADESEPELGGGENDDDDEHDDMRRENGKLSNGGAGRKKKKKRAKHENVVNGGEAHNTSRSATTTSSGAVAENGADQASPGSTTTTSDDDDSVIEQDFEEEADGNDWKVPKPYDPPTVWDEVDVIVDPSDDTTTGKQHKPSSTSKPNELLLIVKLHPKTFATLKQSRLLSPFLRKQHYIALDCMCTAADLCRVMYVRKSWCSYVGKFMEQLGWAERVGALPKFENDCWIYADPDGEPLSVTTQLASYLSSKSSTTSSNQQPQQTIHTVYYRPPLDKDSMNASLKKQEQQQKKRKYDSSSSSSESDDNTDDDDSEDGDEIASSIINGGGTTTSNGTSTANGSSSTRDDDDRARRTDKSKKARRNKKQQLLNGSGKKFGNVGGKNFKKKKRKRVSHFTVKRRRQ